MMCHVFIATISVVPDDFGEIAWLQFFSNFETSTKKCQPWNYCLRICNSIGLSEERESVIISVTEDGFFHN